MTNETTNELIQNLKSMTVEERMAYLRASRPELFEAKPRIASFGKAPKSGWTEADRIK